MSQENAEIVMEVFRRVQAGDLKDAAPLWHPDGRVTPADGWPEPGPFVGRDAVMRQLERLFQDFSESRFEDVELVADSGEWVVMAWRWLTRGEASGLEAEVDLAAAFRLRDGMIDRGHFRWQREEALEAVGLGE
jgi:ketosteroid isomerase-like protein